MNKKKIVWITADCFVDCDFVPIAGLLKYYDICWIPKLSKVRSRYKDSDFDGFKKEHPELDLRLFHSQHRGRDPRGIIENWKLGKWLKGMKADYYYVNIPAATPALYFLWMHLPKDRTIITAHQGAVHAGFKFKRLNKISRWLVYKNAPVVNMFSKSQAALFNENYPKSKVEIIRLALKDYGQPTIPLADAQTRPIRFLSFGQITYNKNHELLIDAACLLYERGYRDFKVMIAGHGSAQEWEPYQKRMKYPEIFETRIELVPNEDIPNLFASCHYFVQPYRIVTQSGAMKVAFNYCRPVIVSDLPGFTDELEEGINGYRFESENVEALANVMKQVMDNHNDNYNELTSKMKTYIDKNYTQEAICSKYKEMFEKLK